MKISEALTKARKALDQISDSRKISKSVSTSKLDSLILLTHAFFVLGKTLTKEQIIFNPDLQLNQKTQEVFFKLIARRANREPVSQIIGKKEFFGEDFLINSDVLDPRPDSETLIELALKTFPLKNHRLKILELGVGSGCLVITLLKNLENALATAIDISCQALEVAQKNATKHRVENRLKLLQSDLFSNIYGFSKKDRKFDLVVSNPPYINSGDIENLQDEVRIYEPRIALDGGIDGLDFYRRIAANVQNFLRPKGKIIVEIGAGQELEIIKIFAANNFILEASKPDLAGIQRALCFS